MGFPTSGAFYSRIYYGAAHEQSSSNANTRCSRLQEIERSIVEESVEYSIGFIRKIPEDIIHSNDRGEPAASYKWTGWVLKNDLLKFKTAGESPIHSEGIHRIYPNLMKENQRMWTCNRLDLQTLGSQPVMPPLKISPTRGVHCTKHVRVYVSAQKGY